jgi:hypothetical protein
MKTVALASTLTSIALSYATPSAAEEARPRSTTPVSTTTVSSTPYRGEPSVGATERRPHRPLLYTGLVLFSVTYTGSVVAGGAAGDRVEDKNLFIPLVGPWLDVGQRNCEVRRCDDAQEAIWKSLIIASGVVQGASALMVLSSFFIPQRIDAPSTEPRSAAAKPRSSFHIGPVSYAAGGGIAAVGRF